MTCGKEIIEGQQESLDKRMSEGKETCLSWRTQRKKTVQGREARSWGKVKRARDGRTDKT